MPTNNGELFKHIFVEDSWMVFLAYGCHTVSRKIILDLIGSKNGWTKTGTSQVSGIDRNLRRWGDIWNSLGYCKYSHLPIAIGTLVWKKDGKSSICVHIFFVEECGRYRDFPVPKKSAKLVDVQTAHCVKVTLQVRNDPTALHLRSAESAHVFLL